MFGIETSQAKKYNIAVKGWCDMNSKLQAVRYVLGHRQSGVFKRIDENRELMELLQEAAPEFIQKHPWVMGWLEPQDDFLSELAQASGLQNHHIRAGQGFPRPYPLKRKVKND